MSLNIVRNDLNIPAERVVVKIGTTLITSEQISFDALYLKPLVAQVATLFKQGVRFVIVSSGAIGAGMAKLKFQTRPQSIPLKQALAAVGQNELMTVYQKLFKMHHIEVGQVLLTQEDFINRRRYVNIKNTLSTLFKLNIIPIINENDPVAVEEIRFGDNDTLAALVTNLIEAELLIILSDVDGLYTADPRISPEAKVIKVVKELTPEVEKLVYPSRSKVTSGGMKTKLTAARLLSQCGESLILANGRERNVLLRIFEGEELGTLFLPQGEKLAHRKRWIAFIKPPQGQIIIDAGATKALSHNKSLLPSGIMGVKGEFEIGDAVEVLSSEREVLGRGLVNYNSGEIDKIKGAHSSEIERILGYSYTDEVIHKDNFVFLKS
jgi:glutamate 5-kinase